MIFIKEENGNVLFNDGTGVVKSWSNQPTIIRLNASGDAVIIMQGADMFSVFAADVTGYQIMPAASSLFSGTAPQLIDLLQELFFNWTECCESGGTPGGGLEVGGWVFVVSKADLPAPVLGDIMLAANTTYVITNNLDLTGDRLVCAQNTTIIGGSSENSSIFSTGLVGLALIKSEYSIPMRGLTITADIALDLAATTPNQAIDWFGVNFTNCNTVGTVSGYSNFVMTDSAFLNSQGLTFAGTVGTIGFLQCLFSLSVGGTAIIVPATATISRRLRLNYCAVIVDPTGTGLNVSVLASIPVEGYFLDTVNFAGGGTYIVGVQHTDNKAFFTNCRGISNSGSISQYYMQANVTPTVIAVTGTFTKVLGTTTSGAYVEKFTNTANRATYDGALVGYFRVTAVLTLSSGNNNIISARIAKNGTTSPQSETSVTTDAAGRVENCTTQDIVLLSLGDYVEVFITNKTATNNVIVENLSLIIERLN